MHQLAIELLKKVYEEKKETIEYLIKFGTETEKVKANLIKEIACQSF